MLVGKFYASVFFVKTIAFFRKNLFIYFLWVYTSILNVSDLNISNKLNKNNKKSILHLSLVLDYKYNR